MRGKTGTLTLGVLQIEQVIAPDGVGPDELVRLAASLDQLSAHPFAEALVSEARGRGLALAFPRDVTEAPGSGISGLVEDRAVAVGSENWLRTQGLQEDGPTWAERVDPGRAVIAVAVDGRAAGAIVLTDRLRGGHRPDAAPPARHPPEGLVSCHPRGHRGACGIPAGGSAAPLM